MRIYVYLYVYINIGDRGGRVIYWGDHPSIHQ
jgi:hypothetical protein